MDAHLQRRPVLEPDLADPAVPRWLAFTPPAVAAGVRAVFGFPLDIGSARLGALNLYRDRPGPLTGDQHADALTMASVAARAVIGMQPRPGRTLGAELEVGTNFQFVVHQAAGMVSVQIGASVTEALIRLRAHAFRHGQLVGDVAKDVVDRRLRLRSRRRRRNPSTVTTAKGDRHRSEPCAIAYHRRWPVHASDRPPVTTEVDMTREALLARTMVELADTLVDDFDIVDLLTTLSERCVEVLDIAAAGIMLVAPDGELRVMTSSSEAMRVVELFELQSQEGPCLDCYRTGRPVVNAGPGHRQRPLAPLRRCRRSPPGSAPLTPSRCGYAAKSSAPSTCSAPRPARSTMTTSWSPKPSPTSPPSPSSSTATPWTPTSSTTSSTRRSTAASSSSRPKA